MAKYLEHVEVTVDSESDDRGILGLDPGIPAGALSGIVAVAIRARSAAPAVTAVARATWTGPTRSTGLPSAEATLSPSRKPARKPQMRRATWPTL